MKNTLRWTLATALVLCAASCTLGEEEDDRSESDVVDDVVVPLGDPAVFDVSRDAITIGEPLLIRGENFLEGGDQGFTRLTFDGEFRADSGEVIQTTFTVTPVFDSRLESGDDVLSWGRFGPFANPFSVMSGTGTFVGRISATNVTPDGGRTGGELSPEVTIRVNPSIVIESLQPIVADCGAPAIRGIGGLPYELRVRAVGFAPARWEVEADRINADDGLTTFEKVATGPTMEMGWDEPFILNPVGDGEQYYVTNIRVIAYDSQDRAVETALPFSVHRPVEVRYNGNFEVAEYFEPVPVSGCIPGQIGNRVTYSETVAETRQRSVSVTVSSNWNRANGVTSSRDWNEGFSEGSTSSVTNTSSLTASESDSTAETYGVTHNESEANSIDFTSSDGETWDYNTTDGTTTTEALNRMNELSTNAEVNGSVKVGGEVGIPAVANGSVETTVGVRAGVGASHSWGSVNTTGAAHSEGYSTGGNASDTEAFGSVTSEGSSSSMGGSYVVGTERTQARGLSDTEARNESRTYSFGEGVAESEVVTEGITTAEEETWVESSTNTTLTSYSATIPPSRFGVFYRQTTRLVRRAEVFSYSLCGALEKQGEMGFNEWTWAPELAISDECGATLPASSLPARECIIPPCFE